MARSVAQANLLGDWRRRRGTSTEAHLYAPGAGGVTAREGLQLPRCGKRIERVRTEAARRAVPCTGCLVAAITERRAPRG